MGDVTKVSINGTNTSSLKTTIPYKVKELMGLEKGSYLNWEFEEDKVIVRKIK